MLGHAGVPRVDGGCRLHHPGELELRLVGGQLVSQMRNEGKQHLLEGEKERGRGGEGKHQ